MNTPSLPAVASAPYPGFEAIRQLIGDPGVPERTRMERALVRLARWRQTLLVNTFRSRQGNSVYSGPFAGMQYTQATEGATLPRLIGCYEAELHATLLGMRDVGYRNVVDIGCAEGYYAVGLARLFPDARVFAHDVSTSAQQSCANLAALNEVADRVQVGGLFDGEALAQLPGRTLVFCDIEGGEAELLDPARVPALRHVDVIVETHECFRRGLVDLLSARFGTSHDIEWIRQAPDAPRLLPDWVFDLSHLDQILCTWEWRAGPTPWAVMRVRDRQPG